MPVTRRGSKPDGAGFILHPSFVIFHGMTRRIRLELPLLLPGIPEDDACVGRVEELIAGTEGVVESHVVRGPDSQNPSDASTGDTAADSTVDSEGESADSGAARLCVHFDSDILSLSEVRRVAKQAGARVSERYAHEVLPIRAIDGEDAARRLEQSLEDVPGVLAAAVNLAAQRARVEYDREVVELEPIVDRLRSLGYAATTTPQSGPGCCAPREPVESDAGWYRLHRELVLSLIAGVFLLLAWTGERWLGLGGLVVGSAYAASYAFGGADLLRHWVAAARRGRVSFDIDLLMLLAAGGPRCWVRGRRVRSCSSCFLSPMPRSIMHSIGRGEPSGRWQSWSRTARTC